MKNLILLATLIFSSACADNTTPVAQLENGEACDVNNLEEVCASGLCLEEFGDGLDLNEGLCTTTCEWDDNLEDFTRTCADDESCIKYGVTDELFCFGDCSWDSDCRTEDGWWCQCWDYFCFEGHRGTCFPPSIEGSNNR